MQGAFIISLTYRPPIVLERQLLPFSSWHGLILEAAASPYLCVGDPVFEDLIFGIWICSHGFSDGYEKVADVDSAIKWGQKFRKTKKNKNIFTDAMNIFTEYIDVSFSAPKFWPKAGDDNQIRAPFWWHCAYFAMHKLHLTETQAWNYPLMRISCCQACAAEISGNTDLISDDQMLALEQNKKESK